MTSAFSTPTHENVPLAGLTKALNMSHNGFRINVFPQLAGPIIITLRPFPCPLINAFFIAFLNSLAERLFHCSVCKARYFHCSLQLTTQSASLISSSICNRILVSLCSLSTASTISQRVCIIFKEQGVLFRTYRAISVLPSSICLLAKCRS